MKFIKKIGNRITTAIVKLKNKSLSAVTVAKLTLADTRGEIATNTFGAIILGVVLVGLLLVATNAFFPEFFASMFDAMGDKLNQNW